GGTRTLGRAAHAWVLAVSVALLVAVSVGWEIDGTAIALFAAASGCVGALAAQLRSGAPRAEGAPASSSRVPAVALAVLVLAGVGWRLPVAMERQDRAGMAGSGARDERLESMEEPWSWFARS